ncbi:MFS transporter [Natranaerobius thermophilus]|uniref:Major facilitator superfamily MFS_1 n=1 Tax=Natranaerobius thermophilus (strain ATCC BAA-1301 / DSM 18059 / JW/NM-WN-LF) TaxID=457570 RepID=B2A615_NATTJ|nr:MFS transporter [Natranaerobius thermophilus]ACB85432.1 major facilitator superfamily MFS_1 [Natranaerobius thermophilus JW/NM-WN-LF]
MQQETKKYLAALSGVPFIMVLGNSLIIPAFPEIQNQLNLTQLEVGLLVTTFSIAAGITIPIVGFISDKYGRKVVLVPSVFLYAIGGLISGFAPIFFNSAYPWIIFGRVVKGIGAGGTGPIAMALAGDLFQSGERSEAMGVLEAANGIGKVVSPILGAIIVVWIWYSVFFVYTIFSLPVAIMLWVVLKEPEQKAGGSSQEEKGYFTRIFDVFKDKKMVLIATYLAGFTVLFSLFGTLSYLSDILEIRYNLEGAPKGIVIALPVIVMAVTSYTTGHFIQSKLLMSKLVVTGLTIIGLSFGGIILLLDNDYALFAGIILIGVGTGLVLTSVNTLVTSTASGRARGGVTSLYGSVRFFGVAFGPPAFGLLVEISRIAMFGTAGIIAILVMGVNLIMIKFGIGRELNLSNSN